MGKVCDFFEIFKKHSFGTIWDQSGVTADPVTADPKTVTVDQISFFNIFEQLDVCRTC